VAVLLVPFEEIGGSPTYALTRTGITATRTLKVRWDYVDALVREFNPRPGNLFATFPGRRALWVDTIDIQPWPSTDPQGELILNPYQDMAWYQWAQVKVNYTTKPHDTEDGNSPRQGDKPNAGNDTILSHKVTVGGEYLILPSKGLVWSEYYDPKTDQHGIGPIMGVDKKGNPVQVGGGSRTVAEEVNAGVFVPTVEHNITWHYVAFPPWTAMRTAVGKVNSASWIRCPPGTVLFLGAEASIDISAEETKYWTVDYKFVYKNQATADDPEPKGWNYFLRPASGLWEKIERKPPTVIQQQPALGQPVMVPLVDFQAGVDRPVYDSADFGPLFVPSVF
jgi:hypothetical protein